MMIGVEYELMRRREHLGISREDLGCRLGCSEERIRAFEESGTESSDFIAAVLVELGIDPKGVTGQPAPSTAATDLMAFEEWRKSSAPKFELYGYVAGVTYMVRVPEGVTEAEAVAFAIQKHREKGTRFCLAIANKGSLWIRADGAVHWEAAEGGVVSRPYTTLGRG